MHNEAKASDPPTDTRAETAASANPHLCAPAAPATPHQPAAPTLPAGSAPAPDRSSGRAKALTLVGIVVLLGLSYGGYTWYEGRMEESTDNAYVQGNVVQITPQIGGTVSAIFADDTEFVKSGQALVQLDTADAQVAVQMAQAQLAQAVRQVRSLYANNTTLEAQITLRETDIAKAQTELNRAGDDLARRQSLSGSGAVSREEVAHAQAVVTQAQTALNAARNGVASARDQLQSGRTQTDGTSLENHPSVMAASAKLREAYLALHRAAINAPVDGQVAKRTAQLGQRIAAGTPLMSVIALKALWVDANFKEVQLRNIRIGQPVTLTADLYGKRVVYRGTVAGMSAGTGAAFSLLPAQNATGNWIKVVQRVPVRIRLDPQEITANPLRVGLSMEATVNVSDQSGKTLAESAPLGTPAAEGAQSPVQTDAYAAMDAQATEEIQRIVRANAGGMAKPAGK
jgi:membrane fusion protein (multidrug efflux system)